MPTTCARPAALALTAALFHVFNHSVFKSLLFFGSGAVLTATGERDMERLGGLIHRMPLTAFAFLIGSAAISALPPFNGFVSEWLTFQAILLSPQLPQWVLKFLVPAIGALLALSAALAAACFVKAFGITFLGRPRTSVAQDAQRNRSLFADRDVRARRACAWSPASCPAISSMRSRRSSRRSSARSMPQQARLEWLTIVPIAESRSSYNGLLLFVLIAVAACLAAYVIHRWASHATRRSAAWDCGFPDASPATQYTAGSFAQPIRRVFGTSCSARARRSTCRRPGIRGPRDCMSVCAISSGTPSMCRSPRSSASTADVLNRVQFLTIRGYLTLVFGALVALLVILAVWQWSSTRSFSSARCCSCCCLRRCSPATCARSRRACCAARGRRLLQPYRDLLKLLRKEVVLADNASWVFRVAPYVIFATTWVAAALVPTFATGLVFSSAADMIAIVALLGSARFMLALAGLDVGTSFGGIGSSREMMIASLAEPAMLMVVFTLSLLAGSTQLSSVATFMQGPGVGLRVSLAMALSALVMVAIAENARIPVDNPATHLELTMVHEAMILEYSGRHLAVIEAAASLKLLLYLSVIGCVFAPWGVAVAGQGSTPTRSVSLVYVDQARRRRASCWPCSRRPSPRCACSASPTSSARR